MTSKLTEKPKAQHDAEIAAEDRTMTPARAAGASGVRNVCRRFVENQDEPEAQAKLDVELAEALSLLGRHRDWDLDALRPILLEMQAGRWRLRQVG